MFAAPGDGASPARRTGSYYSTAARKVAEAEREYARGGMQRRASLEQPCVERAVADNEACTRFFAGAGVDGMRNARKRTLEGASGVSAGDYAARAAVERGAIIRAGDSILKE
jgi:hypothetical protein